MPTFRFVWNDGSVSEGQGATVEDAFTKLGYGAGAVPALDYHEQVRSKVVKEAKAE